MRIHQNCHLIFRLCAGLFLCMTSSHLLADETEREFVRQQQRQRMEEERLSRHEDVRLEWANPDIEIQLNKLNETPCVVVNEIHIADAAGKFSSLLPKLIKKSGFEPSVLAVRGFGFYKHTLKILLLKKALSHPK
ncbi:hypothetical protein [Neisseria iguanae]|nr:hypothetical protein [Neisseria iguanae]